MKEYKGKKPFLYDGMVPHQNPVSNAKKETKIWHFMNYSVFLQTKAVQHEYKEGLRFTDCRCRHLWSHGSL
jgi:hypothetical protein